jgi:hypothetical protein
MLLAISRASVQSVLNRSVNYAFTTKDWRNVTIAAFDELKYTVLLGSARAQPQFTLAIAH